MIRALMKRLDAVRVLRFAAVLAIVALLLILWATYDTSVVSVMLSMSLGQAIGTLSLVLYLGVLAVDLKKRLGTPSLPPPAPPPSGTGRKDAP